MTPRQLRDAANGPWPGPEPGEWNCPDCGHLLYDMRGKAFNVSQAAEAGMCVYIGNGDYTCAELQLARDQRRRYTPLSD